MDSAYSTHRISAKCMHKVRWEVSKKKEQYEDLGKDGRIIIIWVYRMGEYRMCQSENRGVARLL
jgi:hypothetical protein